MSDIIEFPKPKKPGDPVVMSGNVKCLACRYEWIGEAPIGTKILECPACKLNRGHWVGDIHRDGPHWHCGCGNDLFYIQRDEIYCASCGKFQRFPNDK